MSKSTTKIDFHHDKNSSLVLTCVDAYVRPGKRQMELLRRHKSLATKYSYSDEVFLLPARRIPIRIDFHKNSSLKTPEHVGSGHQIKHNAPLHRHSLDIEIIRSMYYFRILMYVYQEQLGTTFPVSTHKNS